MKKLDADKMKAILKGPSKLTMEQQILARIKAISDKLDHTKGSKNKILEELQVLEHALSFYNKEATQIRAKVTLPDEKLWIPNQYD